MYVPKKVFCTHGTKPYLLVFFLVGVEFCFWQNQKKQHLGDGGAFPEI
jgi:hypothetical protein